MHYSTKNTGNLKQAILVITYAVYIATERVQPSNWPIEETKHVPKYTQYV